jgi:hypothetical protein
MRGIKTFFLAVILATVGTANCPAAESAGLKMLRVDGRQLKTIDGKTAHLEGVNLPSMEWGQGEHLAESERRFPRTAGSATGRRRRMAAPATGKKFRISSPRQRPGDAT